MNDTALCLERDGMQRSGVQRQHPVIRGGIAQFVRNGAAQ